MEAEGPPLEILLRRISEIPEDFLAEPKIGASGKVVVPAVVNDLADCLQLRLTDAELARFAAADARKDGARLAVVLQLCWVLNDGWLREKPPQQNFLLQLLGETAAQLAQQATPAKYVQDPDRREEVARLILAAFGLRPAGETKSQAQDRLTSLSGLERDRVLSASRLAEERARAIREALARKVAEESADKWTRD